MEYPQQLCVPLVYPRPVDAESIPTQLSQTLIVYPKMMSDLVENRLPDFGF